MVLINRKGVHRMTQEEFVSVLSRGLWFLSDLAQNLLKGDRVVFPSPCGDYGSYRGPFDLAFQAMPKLPSPYGDYGSYQCRKLAKCGFEDLFPSPYGDYGSYRVEGSS